MRSLIKAASPVELVAQAADDALSDAAHAPVQRLFHHLTNHLELDAIALDHAPGEA